METYEKRKRTLQRRKKNEKRKGKKKRGKGKKKREKGRKKKCLLRTSPSIYTTLFFIHTREITRGPLMNVADRHGYGSEMRQKAIMVEQKKEMHLFVRIS